MKFTFFQFLLSIMLTAGVLATPRDSNGQDILDKVISISVENAKVKAALSEIEKLVSIKFTYNPQSIPINRKITGEFKNEKLSEVLNQLLVPLKIQYEVSGDYIILSKENEMGSEGSMMTPTQTFVAQSVSGTVTDDTGSALPGVNVIEKGTSNGTATDVQGKFTLSVADANSVLVFTFIGYETKEVPIGNETMVNVSLSPDTKTLEEVVVVGYGTQDRKEITSAVASVTPENFNKGNITDVAQLLQGKVAGLTIARPGGDPNGNFTMRLRGLSSLGANTQPLVVIDGQIGADLNSVDPNDIKSIDILKDGSAAAIYGTRGSAGVVLVTTKSGVKKGGGTQIDYNGYLTVESAARTIPVMSASEFRTVAPANRDFGANTNWLDEITRNAVSHTHNLSISSSNQSGTSFRASVNYRNIQGVAINTDLSRLNTRLNLRQTALKDKLEFNFNFASTGEESNLGWTDAFKFAAIFNPTAPVYATNPQNDLSGGGFFEENFVAYNNPVAVLKQNKNERQVTRVNFLGSASYQFFESLKGTINYSQQRQATRGSIFLPRDAYYLATIRDNPVVVTSNGFGRKGYARRKNDDTFNQLVEGFLSYDKDIAGVSLSAVAGYSYQDFINSGSIAGGGNFITDASADDVFASLDLKKGTGDVDSYKNGSILVAFFGRLNLSYKNTYFLSASVRREGSTQFGKNNRWGNFPAVSAGVDLAQLAEIPIVNTLKLRGSYGVTGALPNQSYLSLSTLIPGTSSFYAGSLGYISAYGLARNPNPNLKWETKKETDIGIDFALLENRLSGSIDYYKRTTSDLIYQATVPVPPNLINTTYLNVGTMTSSGVELAVGYDVIKRTDFTWNTRVNFSSFNVKLDNLDTKQDAAFALPAANLGTPGQEATTIARVIPGQRIGTLWGPTLVGIDENGKYIFKDLDGDGKFYPTDTDDQGPIGNGLPSFEFGWSNSFSYGHFDFNFFLRGSIGHDLVNSYRGFYENAAIATTYNVVKTKYYNPNLNDAQIFNSSHVEDASFVKLDNATLGYNVQLPAGGSFRNLRVYFTAQNLFVITNYTGPDPEVRYADPTTTLFADPALNQPSSLTPGIDRRETWILPRSFTLGVNVGF